MTREIVEFLLAPSGRRDYIFQIDPATPFKGNPLLRKRRRCFDPKSRIFASLILLLCTPLLSVSQSLPLTGSTDLRLALKKLQVLGGALYVAAHPDDENTSVIAALAKGRLLRTAYLAMTRGEGGQNLIGPEQGDVLGVIRTQELLAARRIDGGEQFFTRARDFGYSKTSEETIRIWGREAIVSDIVWVIRTFRPDVIITRFADTLGGHGNHTSSAILAREAFYAAGDPKRFPEQLQYVKPWQPKRIVFNVFRFRGAGMDPTENAVRLDVGEYSPILGESFTEIAGKSRTMHKSQGFGAGQNRGTQWQFFEPTAGDPAREDLFDGVNTSWSRIPGGAEIGALLGEAEKSFLPDMPSSSVPLLVRAYRKMSSLDDPWIRVKKEELVQVLLGCLGIRVDANSAEPYASPGGEVRITLTALNRSEEPILLQSVRGPFLRDTSIQKILEYNRPFEISAVVSVPESSRYTQPFWLQEEPREGTYVIDDQKLIGEAENPPALTAQFVLRLAGEQVTIDAPVRFRWVDPVDGEQYRPFVIVPPVAVNLIEKTYVFSDDRPREIRVVVKGSGKKQKGRVRLTAPQGWTVSPDFHPFVVHSNGDEVPVAFKVFPGPSALSGRFAAGVEIERVRISAGRMEVRYPHIPIQVLFPPATGMFVRVELKKTGGRIGYIAGSGDEIPSALQQLGYDVTMLSDDDLEFSDFDAFNAIVAGVRAYNTRPKLKAQQRRLMEYVLNGGRYVVQYVTQQRLESDDLGPYPFSISRERVTVEEAPVSFEKADHPLLRSPNKITARDFDGWIQERGLYFADSWDARYETILGSADPGEPLQKGGLLFARYGKGTYIYTGYSFFRQLPAGVAGAYRLFVNLISHQ